MVRYQEIALRGVGVPAEPRPGEGAVVDFREGDHLPQGTPKVRGALVGDGEERRMGHVGPGVRNHLGRGGM